MPSRYILLTVSIPEEFSDLAMGVVSTYPIAGVEMGTDTFSVCFEQNDWQEAFQETMLAEMVEYGVPAKFVETTVVEGQNWNAEWESGIEPVVVNERIVIVPEWRAAEYDHPLTLVITPKMSFGTGHHATTRMMCNLVEQSVKPGDRWTDAGTGTGVLAILAAKLGAVHVYAFDNDEWSILNAKENVLRNGVDACIDLEQVDLKSITLPVVDGLAANLYRHLVIPFATAFVQCVKPGGTILLSGILKYDYDEVLEPFLELGCSVVDTLNETEWCAIRLSTPNVK